MDAKALLATSALAVALSGGASAALAQGEASTTTADVSSAQERPGVTSRSATTARTAGHRVPNDALDGSSQVEVVA